MFTTKHAQAWARALPMNTPGASRSSGSSTILSTTQGRAPCRSAKTPFQMPTNSARARKLSRLMARVTARRGFSHSRDGKGLGVLATGNLQAAGGFRQTLAEGSAQGDFMFIQRAFGVCAG